MIFSISWAEVIHWDLVILFVIGGGLIWLLYGVEQALTAELCMGGLLALFGGMYWLILKLLKAISDSDNE